MKMLLVGALGTLAIQVLVIGAVFLVGPGLAASSGGLGGPQPGPQPGRQLVSSGVQSVTICEKHDRIFNRMAIPGGDEGLWAPEKTGGCYTWYHYAEGEE